MSEGTYADYARSVLAGYGNRSLTKRNLLFAAVENQTMNRVLDLGCGPGQELLPFLENSQAECVGVDIAAELGDVAIPFFREKGFGERARFVRATGDAPPFSDASFDLVLCRVALPYMHNRKTIAEVARVMNPGATFLLKTHAPPFYFAMIAERLKNLNPKQLAYPVICLFASGWHSAPRKQLSSGIWRGKEIFQTRSFLEKELKKNGLQITSELPDSNKQTPSFRIIKTQAG